MALQRKMASLNYHPILSYADQDTLKRLAEKSTFVEVQAGDYVLTQGDKVDSIYIVISGQLERQAGQELKRRPKQSELTRTDSFGNIAFVTEASSWCSIRAVNDSLLVKLSRDILIDELEGNTDLNQLISSNLGSLVGGEQQHDFTFGEIISIGSAESKIGKSLFGINLAGVLADETDEKVCLVDFTQEPAAKIDERIVTMSNRKLGPINEKSRIHDGGFEVFPVEFPESVSNSALRAFLATLSERSKYVVIIMPDGYNQTIERIINQSERLYLLTTDSEQAIYETSLMLDSIYNHLEEPALSTEVVLNRSTEDSRDHRKKVSDQLDMDVKHQLPEIETKYVENFFDKTPFVLTNPSHTYSKKIRHIAHEAGNISLGLALGSGAARGLAHIGVLEVLQENDIKPDLVGGSSMGALIAAGYALGHSPTKMKRHAEMFVDQGGFFRIWDMSVPPNRSILRSSHMHNFLQTIFGDTTFEDTEIPLKIMVSDIETSEDKVITSGSIVEAVLASISIPMIFQPHRMNGKRYVDGGILHPVPVNNIIDAGADRVIAVNPIPPKEVLREQQPERLHLAEDSREYPSLLKYLFPIGKNNLIDIGMRTIEAIEARFAEYTTARADVIIDPYLAELSWFDFEEYEIFIQQGRDSAKDKIEALKALTSPSELSNKIEEHA